MMMSYGPIRVGRAGRGIGPRSLALWRWAWSGFQWTGAAARGWTPLVGQYRCEARTRRKTRPMAGARVWVWRWAKAKALARAAVRRPRGGGHARRRPPPSRRASLR